MANGVSSKDAAVSTQIFRKDNPMILACDRHLAVILPVRLAYESTNGGVYAAGTVLARNSTSGLYQRYNNSASSGLDTAKCVLFFDASPASGDTDLAKGVFAGQLNQDLLTGLDAPAIVDLNARAITDSSGSNILIF